MTEAAQQHPASVACEFMRRADLKGGEVEAYAQTYNWLQGILAKELEVIPVEALSMLQQDSEELAKLKEEIEADEQGGDVPVLTPEDLGEQGAVDPDTLD